MAGMKKSLLTTLVLSTVLFSLLGADAVIKEFRVEPGINKTYLSWKVSLESNIKGYQIQRGFESYQLTDLDFLKATEDPIPPGTAKNYSYTDQSIFKTEGRTFYYRIAVLNYQNEIVTTSEVCQVSPQVSAVRHTWGSIKAMFR